VNAIGIVAASAVTRSIGARVAFALFAALVAGAAAAQYPAKPIKLIVTIPPGGAPDIVGRVVAQKLSEALGQPMVVENRVGSNGNIGAEIVAKSAADGYTLLLGQDSIFVINPHLYGKAPVELGRDLVAVASLANNMFVLSVNPSVPVKTFQEFIDYARRADPPLNYASAGNGSQHHLTMERLKARAGINLVHIPYKGGVPATLATVAGDVAVMMSGTSTAPQIRAGRLRALAVTGARRSAVLPELPMIGEFYPGFEMTNWYGLFAPAGTPEVVIARLRAEVGKLLQLADTREKLKVAGGIEPWPTTPEEFAAVIRDDYDRYGKLVRELGAKVD